MRKLLLAGVLTVAVPSLSPAAPLCVAGDLEEPSDRPPQVVQHETVSGGFEEVRKLGERVDAAGVDERELGEVEHDVTVGAERGERGVQHAQAGEVELAGEHQGA